MHFLWSAKNNVFIPGAMRSQYDVAGWDLSDCIPASDDLVAEYMGDAPAGKIRVTGADGLPAWGDIPVIPALPVAQAS
ncbi:phage tail protein [Mixta calida]|uniref:phage tail protein n=1 Tax=Mixta calida TaxID=665913 RepID=UPI00290F4617|nr:phage tail protein [Mixta calida]MDU6414742.1 phage tail protein [Mixta calida]